MMMGTHKCNINYSNLGCFIVCVLMTCDQVVLHWVSSDSNPSYVCPSSPNTHAYTHKHTNTHTCTQGGDVSSAPPPPPPSAGAPPPPPPPAIQPPTDAPSGGGGSDLSAQRANLFAEINKGGDVTKGRSYLMMTQKQTD